jgi:hypothetical protein
VKNDNKKGRRGLQIDKSETELAGLGFVHAIGIVVWWDGRKWWCVVQGVGGGCMHLIVECVPCSTWGRRREKRGNGFVSNP